MFLDQAVVHLKAGDGGNGMVAFRREKFVPMGGPAGGNGGKGGDIIVTVDNGMRTLIDFRYQKNHKAESGTKGSNKKKNGKNAKPLILRVPPGTVLYNDTTGEKLVDLVSPSQQYIVAHGGRGGKGNVAFASSRNPAPHISENGEPGEEISVRLELVLLADVGFVGMPSVGKSTLLSVMTTAKPKIGAYHFTTLSPQLGVAATNDERSFVIADLPGLIEGAHLGKGLGIQFLQHIRRTRIIVHVLDMSRTDGRDPFADYEQILAELRSFDPSILLKQQVIAANKMDQPGSLQNLEEFKAKCHDDSVEIIEVSGLTSYGVNVLTLKLANMLDAIDAAARLEAEKAAEAAPEVVKTYTMKDVKGRKNVKTPFVIGRNEADDFVIESASLEKLYKMTNMNYHESVMRFLAIMRKAGVDAALKKAGAKPGDTVWIGDFAFEYVDETDE